MVRSSSDPELWRDAPTGPAVLIRMPLACWSSPQQVLGAPVQALTEARPIAAAIGSGPAAPGAPPRPLRERAAYAA